MQAATMHSALGALWQGNVKRRNQLLSLQVASCALTMGLCSSSNVLEGCHFTSGCTAGVLLSTTGLPNSGGRALNGEQKKGAVRFARV